MNEDKRLPINSFNIISKQPSLFERIFNIFTQLSKILLITSIPNVGKSFIAIPNNK